MLLFGKYLPRGGDFIAILAIAPRSSCCSLCSSTSWITRDGTEFVPGEKSWEWVQFGDFEIRLGFFVDQITIVMLAVVSFVALLVQIYSVGYMRGDPKYGWYFTVMSLFAASMLTLVLADNLLLLYAAWEGVGFCSFLLIGFWWERRTRGRGGEEGVHHDAHRRRRVPDRHPPALE